MTTGFYIGLGGGSKLGFRVCGNRYGYAEELLYLGDIDEKDILFQLKLFSKLNERIGRVLFLKELEEI